jgi:16S rRNA (guanine(527)-N(7))-methyltransferase RsmG
MPSHVKTRVEPGKPGDRLPSPQRIQEILRGCGLPIGQALAAAVRHYMELLCHWNQRINLTGFRDPVQIVTSLFGESFWASRLMAEEDNPLLDVGSGAGFPGLALKLWHPQLRCFLVESRKKRAAFLSTVRRELGLDGVFVISRPLGQCRSPDFNPSPRLMTLRAVGPAEALLSQGLSLLGPRGKVLWFTTRAALKEGLPAVPLIRWDPPVPIPWSHEKVLLLGRLGESSGSVPRGT